MTWRVIHADCIEAMRELEPSSVDAVVTDPPYGLEFMGKEWDRLGASIEPTATSAGGVGAYAAARVRYGATFQQMQSWHYAWATEALRVLKPGGHLLSFGGTRTYHRLACALEDAGFEIRDCLAWLYGSGFPKSLDVSKAIDKANGHWRGRAGEVESENGAMAGPNYERTAKGEPVTPDAERWQGWGTALKPAFEPIVLARKPLSGTVAANVLEHGTGALNVDGTRIGAGGNLKWEQPRDMGFHGGTDSDAAATESPLGRWPANVLLDAEAAAMLDEQAPNAGGGGFPGEKGGIGNGLVYGAPGSGKGLRDTGRIDANGGASRFFYTAKTSRAERENGVAQYGEVAERGTHRYGAGIGEGLDPDAPAIGRNHHPTVKPVDLMQWLCRLVTPPGGLVLDPFLGSGSTGIAALREGFDFLGIEREPEYVEIARARIIGDAPLFNMEEGQDAHA